MCSKTKVFFFPYVCLVSFSRPALLQGGQIRPVLCVYWSPWQPFSRDSQQSLSPQKESHFIFLYPKSICIFDNWYQLIYFTFKNEIIQLDGKNWILFSSEMFFVHSCFWLKRHLYCHRYWVSNKKKNGESWYDMREKLWHFHFFWLIASALASAVRSVRSTIYDIVSPKSVNLNRKSNPQYLIYLSCFSPFQSTFQLYCFTKATLTISLKWKPMVCIWSPSSLSS